MAEPFHCDFSGRLFMGHLGNHMLNAADFHSTDRGFGMKRLMSMGRSWVLSRLAIEMTEMPRQYTRFNVETWVESAMRYFTSRNFAIVASPDTSKGGEASTAKSLGAESSSSEVAMYGEQLSHPSEGAGKVLGYGRSIWAMIDTTSRQPTDLFAIDDGAINQWIEKEKPCPIDKGGRVRMSADAELVREIDTYYNDVDINGHINSVKYIEHVLDLWSLDWYREHQVKRFEIAYVAEAHAGDRLSFFREPVEAKIKGADVQGNMLSPVCPLEFCVRICKDGDVEVARSKVVFSL